MCLVRRGVAECDSFYSNFLTSLRPKVTCLGTDLQLFEQLATQVFQRAVLEVQGSNGLVFGALLESFESTDSVYSALSHFSNHLRTPRRSLRHTRRQKAELRLHFPLYLSSGATVLFEIKFGYYFSKAA